MKPKATPETIKTELPTTAQEAASLVYIVGILGTEAFEQNQTVKAMVLNNLDLDALALWRAIMTDNHDDLMKIFKEKPEAEMAMYGLVPCFYSLHESIEYIENQYRGSAKERETKLIPKLSHLLNAGVAIPPDTMRRALAALKVKGFADDPGAKTGRKKNKGASLPPEELRRRQASAGLLRALAELKGWGAVRRFNLSMQRIAFKKSKPEAVALEKETRALLKSTIAQGVYTTYKKIMEKVFLQAEIRKVKIPQDEEQLTAFIDELDRRLYALSPEEWARAQVACSPLCYLRVQALKYQGKKKGG